MYGRVVMCVLCVLLCSFFVLFLSFSFYMYMLLRCTTHAIVHVHVHYQGADLWLKHARIQSCVYIDCVCNM